jgi:putative membrane protein
MMTNLFLFTEMWYWRSPAWLIAMLSISAYTVVAVSRHASRRQIGFFAVSAAAFLTALASPLAFLASRYLFSAHMAQHLLLLLIAPLFAILSIPAPAARIASQSSTQGRGTKSLGWLAGVGAMWFWHIPALCSASMRSPMVFGVQTVSLLAAGAAFWWPVFRPDVSRRMQPQVSAAYLFAGCIGCSLLGIYVTFSPVSVCPLYGVAGGSPEVLSLIHNQWGLTHQSDQQIGGLLMWVPACAVYLSAIMVTLASWYRVPSLANFNTLAME